MCLAAENNTAAPFRGQRQFKFRAQYTYSPEQRFGLGEVCHDDAGLRITTYMASLAT